MTKFRTVIVDDEVGMRALLRLMLVSRSEVEVVGEANGLGQAVTVIEALRPDLVFLDVNLHGKSGFDLFKLTEVQFKTIVMSCVDSGALRAFQVGAVDFLLKPIDQRKLDRAFAKIQNP